MKPVAKLEGEFDLFGVKVKCYVLEDGRRLINAEDIKRLFETMGDSQEIDEQEIMKFAKWCKGV